jgi:16S rRNA (uracil1498-N3)-methyltransferase
MTIVYAESMQTKPRYRLSVTAALAAGASITLSGNAAHYLTNVLRLGVGDSIALFNRTDGEWLARMVDVGKREVVLSIETQLRAPTVALGLTVCFAPIKGGRMETIIEKATELGASVLQPVITARTIVDKVNLERAEAIAREAAEQCERTDWPEIREPVKLDRFLGDWPQDVPLIYGDESGGSGPVAQLFQSDAEGGCVAFHGEPRSGRGQPGFTPGVGGKAPFNQQNWAILAGPEGGFTAEEFAALGRVKSAIGVGLGPRILRADTAIITLCALTLAAWGDWHHAPRFTGGET